MFSGCLLYRAEAYGKLFLPSVFTDPQGNSRKFKRYAGFTGSSARLLFMAWLLRPDAGTERPVSGGNPAEKITGKRLKIKNLGIKYRNNRPIYNTSKQTLLRGGTFVRSVRPGKKGSSYIIKQDLQQGSCTKFKEEILW